jgi:hypothetical protein
MDYRRVISIEPGKRGGKPCVRGLRITVYDVLDCLASGMSELEILSDFPDLTRGYPRLFGICSGSGTTTPRDSANVKLLFD